MIIGICGKSGSGKSYFANSIMANYSGESVHLDIDKVGHESLTDEIVKTNLVETFGDVLTDGIVDRKKLGNIVFADEGEMQKLTDITWGYMERKIDEFISLNSNKLIILDWLLLPKSKFFNMCNLKVLLDIPYDVRKERAQKRDNITEESFALRDSASIIYDEDSFDLVLKDNSEKEVKKVGEYIMTKVLYPGSFDPITKGHMNIVEQACALFDEVIIAIMHNPAKKSGMFDVEERKQMIEELYKDRPNVKVVCGTGASVDLAIENNCKALIRGLRSLSDYDYEVEMQQINKEISKGKVNTLCLFADKDYQFVSSSMVKEVLGLNKDISKYVEPLVIEKMKEKMNSGI